MTHAQLEQVDYLQALLASPDAMPERFAALGGVKMWERNVAAFRERATKSPA